MSEALQAVVLVQSRAVPVDSMKVPGADVRMPVLKQQYDEAWALASEEDREKAAVRFVPRRAYIGGGT